MNNQKDAAMSKDTGGPAFPVHGGHYEGDDPRNQILGGGISVRDYFLASLPDEAASGDYSDSVKEELVGRICPSLSTDGPLAVLEFEAEFRAKWRGMRVDAMLTERAQ